MSRVRTIAGNAVKAILKGELLLHLNIGKYFMHVMYTFFIFGVIIWVSLKIEGTMAKVEANKSTISMLEISKVEKELELAKLERRSTVSRNLSRMGSGVKEATRPATILTR